MEFSFPYVVLFLMMGACAYFYENTEQEERRWNINILAAAIFLFFFGLRGYVYTDWTIYTQLFRDIEWNDILKFDFSEKSGPEPGFLLLCMVCKTIVNDYFFFAFVCTLIYLLLFIRCCRQFGIDNIALVLMLCVAMDGTGMILNLMRNIMSIGIWLNALIYIKERKPLQYLGLCMVALSFHLSALVYFPLYLILHKKFNRWIFAGLFVFFLAFYLSKMSIIVTIAEILGLEGMLGVKVQAYTEVYTASRPLNPSGTLEKLALVTLLFIYYDDIIEHYKNRCLIINSLLIYFFMYYFLGEFKTMSERMSLLFVFARWFIWIDIIRILVIENNRRLLTGIIFMYCLYMTAMNLNQPVMEYDNIVFGAKSEAQRRQIFFKIVDEDE